VLARLARSWHGQETLFQTFWVYGVLINAIFFACGVAAGYLRMPALLTPLAPLYIAYMVWLMVSLWRCAFNAKWRGWDYLARVWVVLVSIGIMLQIGTVVSMATRT
jgi:hypothetical protein